MNHWHTSAGKITDGTITIKPTTAYDYVTSKVPVQKLADKLNCSRKHFIEFAILTCKYLMVSSKRCKHWGKLGRLNGMRLPRHEKWWSLAYQAKEKKNG